MIYGIKLIKSAFNGDCSIWIGMDGWKEPIPTGVPRMVFATEDINKAYAHCENLSIKHPDCRYQVEEFDIEKEVEIIPAEIRLKQR